MGYQLGQSVLAATALSEGHDGSTSFRLFSFQRTFLPFSVPVSALFIDSLALMSYDTRLTLLGRSLLFSIQPFSA